MVSIATVSRRPARRPPASLPTFEALDQTHRHILEMLDQFDKLLAHLDENGADAVARQRAKEVHTFFSEHARRHHADEEALVFPPLLADGDAEMVQTVQRLQQDHGWLEEDWLELAPQIEAVATGYNWYDRVMLRAALPVFADLYREHIALEETVVYPAAKRLRAAG